MMQGILAANNEAAQVLMIQGDFYESVELIEDAVVQLTNPDNDLHPSGGPNNADQNACFFPVRMNEDFPSDSTADSPALNPFAIFAQPFVLRCSRIHKNNFFELHVALLYNKALSLHLQGLKGSPTSERDLLGSLQTYKKGLAVIRKHWLQIDPLSNVHLLFLALLNNAWHLYSHFHCVDGVSRCRRQLSRLLETYQNVGLCRPDEVTEVFYMNNFFANLGSTNAAAAA